VAARLRRELGIDVELVHGRYGEFKVLIDNKAVIDGGTLAFLGVLPSTGEIITTIRETLSQEEQHNSPA